MKDEKELKLVITTFNGLEAILARELVAIGALKVREDRREVTCVGDLGFLYKANFTLRTALNVMIELKRFKFKNASEIYHSINETDWNLYIGKDESFIVDFNSDYNLVVSDSEITTTIEKLIAEKVDGSSFFNNSEGKNNPTLYVQIEIVDEKCRILINSSGDSLEHRGYIQETDDNQLNNVMAAGLVLLSGWEPHTPLIDFLCNTGVIPIEAAFIAAKIPPGTFRKQFAFERWKNFDEELFAVIRDKQLSRITDNPVRIYASDINSVVAENAKKNCIAAGVDDMITISHSDFNELNRPDANGTIILCPAFNKNETVDEMELFYSKIGKCLKNNYAGYKAWLCTNGSAAAGKIGLRYSHKLPLDYKTKNRWFFKYNLFEGEK